MLQDDIKSEFPNIILHISETEYGIRLDTIIVKEEDRGLGTGTRVMRRIMRYAETVQKPVVLTPDSVFGTPKTRLTNWYKSLGFRANTGRSKDFRFSDTMIWTPRKDT